MFYSKRRCTSIHHSSATVITCVIVVICVTTTLSGCATVHSIGSTDSFMPHGYCLAWNPQLLALFIVGNGLVAVSYYSIPAALWIFVRKRQDLAFNWMFRLFAAFIFWCGTTHVMKLWTIWSPNYWAEGAVDLITGLTSAYTAIALWPLIPKALAMRSPQQWEEANAKLHESLEQRKQADQALQENRQLTELIIHSASDAFIAMDTSGMITDWNVQADKIFGWSRSEVLGHPLSETIIPIEHRDAHTRGLKHFLATGDGPVLNQRIEINALHKRGHEFPVELSIFPVRTEKTTTFCAFIQDITERKHSEKSLQKARDVALEASRFKSEFLASMSHEIRTPMNGILGMTEILLRSNLNDSQRGYATTVQEAGRSLLSVINDVLDFSKIEAGKLLLEVEDFEPIRLVESVAELLAEAARQKELSVLTFIDPNISLAVRGDPGRLRQILMNLVGNAIKFSKQGEILIRASLEKKENGSDIIKFSVTDTGIGLTDAEISKLFQPFVQIAGSMTQSGTGLGLSISKRLVGLMGGEIGVHSVKSHGSTFWITVPFERSAGTGRGIRVSPDLSGVRVLIVDDEKAAREVVNDYLVSWGMQTSTAKNAQEALDSLHRAAKSDPYTIIIIDLMMPETNGMQLGKIIREDDTLKSAKIILVTAFDKPGTGEEAISLGFDAYLTKPIKQSQLLDSITTLLRDSGAKEFSLQAIRDAAQEQAIISPLRRDELLLVVEDHRINQEVALLLLKSIGFEAHVANNGTHALELMQRIPYALVFMDCQMPELDGFDTTRALRKVETRTGKHVPVIAMTAHVIEGSREQCLAAGMDDYISKPIDVVRLQQVMDKWLPHSTTASESRDASTAIASASSQGHFPLDVHEMELKFGASAGELINMFIRDTPLRLDKLKQAATAQDTIELLWCIHGLKGVCATLFAMPMRQLCVDIESAAQQRDWTTISGLVDELIIEFERVKDGTAKFR